METNQVPDESLSPAERSVTRSGTLSREVFVEVANKWTLLVINVLAERTVRFSVLLREVDGISQKMLTQTLRSMERNGVVERTVYPTVPPRVDYHLTDAGLALRNTVNGICVWTFDHLDHIEQARERFASARTHLTPDPDARP